MRKYGTQIWIEVNADNLEDAIGKIHTIADHIETELAPVVASTYIDDAYYEVINEYGDQIPAND